MITKNKKNYLILMMLWFILNICLSGLYVILIYIDTVYIQFILVTIIIMLGLGLAFSLGSSLE